MRATIKDVARYAGVSVATVSRVLNGNDNVKQSTYKIVQQAIEDLDYVPNYLGRNLRKRETNTILAIVPNIEHTYYSGILQGMAEKSHMLGYDMVISFSNSNEKTEERLMGMLVNRTVDAVILLGTRLSAEYLNDMCKKYCISLCCERIQDSDILTLSVNDELASYDAVSYLMSLGHTHVGMVSIGIEGETIFSAIEREEGYKKALTERNIPVDERLIYRGTYDCSSGEDAMEYFLTLEEPPTAIFAVSDLLAMGLIRKAIAHNIVVGKELSIMGFDNTSLSKVFIPGITTVEQPCKQIGRDIVSMTVDNLQRKGTHVGRHFAQHNLVFRESTGALTPIR